MASKSLKEHQDGEMWRPELPGCVGGGGWKGNHSA